MNLLNTLIQVSRTSTRWNPDIPPCEGAVRHQVQGTRLVHVHWTISFATLEELEEFITEHNEVVITPPDPNATLERNREMGSIEIYDAYRE